MNDNENMTIQNLWDAAKADLRVKFIAIQSYLKKQEKSQIKNITLHLKELEKKVQARLLYPARISFRFNGKIKNFTDKQKLREFSTTKPLQQMLKELL